MRFDEAIAMKSFNTNVLIFVLLSKVLNPGVNEALLLIPGDPPGSQ